MKNVVISSIIILVLILIGTFIGIFYARGYRIDPTNPKTFFEGTGVLVLTSKPDGARVLINDHVTTATNNTINLGPGTYKVRIEKDGYSSWQKTIEIKKEVVSQANALLFPIAPRLESVTTTGASNPIIDSTGTLIAYTVASASAENNGIYTIDMNSRIIPLGGGANQIANDNNALFAQSTLLGFSPTGTQLIASVSGKLDNSIYLLSSKNFNANPQDVTNTIEQIQKDWQTQIALKNKKLIDSLPKKLRPIATQNFSSPVISPLEDKILYTASVSATIPILITPRLPGTNPTPEKRNIQKGNVYVYDLKEDRNYLIDALDGTEEASKYLWYPDANHLVFVKSAKVSIVESDGTNRVTIYAGPFVDGFAFPWPDGSSIVILTNLNIPEVPTNLYRISLR